MHPSKPGNHAYGSFQARTQELRKKEKIESAGTTSNDTESIQIAPRDCQKLEFFRNPRFFIFHEIHKKIKNIEISGTASNDTESIQIPPRDDQKLEFWPHSRFFNF